MISEEEKMEFEQSCLNRCRILEVFEVLKDVEYDALLKCGTLTPFRIFDSSKNVKNISNQSETFVALRALHFAEAVRTKKPHKEIIIQTNKGDSHPYIYKASGEVIKKVESLKGKSYLLCIDVGEIKIQAYTENKNLTIGDFVTVSIVDRGSVYPTLKKELTMNKENQNH